LLEKGLAHPGAVVITDHQLSGKGQRGNRWESNPGENLTFSMILRPEFMTADKNFYLNIVTALALTDALMPFHESFQIKWPNDIYHHHKKIGGILIENSILSNRIASSVIGIGLNVNQVRFPDLDDATSLYRIFSRQFDLNEILNTIIFSFDRRWKTLNFGGFKTLEVDYLSRLYALGEKRNFRIDGRITVGIIEGIDPAGRLIVQIEGEKRIFSFQEIKFLK
jgi:BirA family transcriptional regulator, biotin operon repressor / biotin---[acetyl-CoA-carboxylase] ligase